MHNGLASPSDFWMFYGHLYWTSDEYQRDLSKGLWQPITAPTKECFAALRSVISSKADFGIEAWRLLANSAISDNDSKSSIFCKIMDKRLKEWSLNHLPMTRSQANNNTSD